MFLSHWHSLFISIVCDVVGCFDNWWQSAACVLLVLTNLFIIIITIIITTIIIIIIAQCNLQIRVQASRLSSRTMPQLKFALFYKTWSKVAKRGNQLQGSLIFYLFYWTSPDLLCFWLNTDNYVCEIHNMIMIKVFWWISVVNSTNSLRLALIVFWRREKIFWQW